MDPSDNPFPPPDLDITAGLPDISGFGNLNGSENNDSTNNQQGNNNNLEQNNDAPQDDNNSDQNIEFPLIDHPALNYQDPLPAQGSFTVPHESSLHPVWIAPETEGFRNGPNSCYLNSALQCLTHSPPFASIFLNHHGAHRSPPVPPNPNFSCMFCALEELSKKMLVNGASSRTLKAFASHIYHKTPQIFAEDQFEKKQQQDSGKFLKNLLLMLGTIENGRRCGDLTMKPLNEILSSSIFQTCSYAGIYRTTCTNCNQITTMSGPGFILPLSTAKGDTVEDILKAEAEEQTIQDFVCGSCGVTGLSKRKFFMTRAPNVLIIRLQRSGLGSGDKGGIEPRLKCRYEAMLNISMILEEAQGVLLPQAQYELTGVVSYKPHKGQDDRYDWDDDFRTGRYMSYVRSTTNEWTRKYDDKKKKMIVEKQVMEQHAFLLFYVRQGSHTPPPTQEEQQVTAGIQQIAQNEASGGQPQGTHLQPQGPIVPLPYSDTVIQHLLSLHSVSARARNGESVQIREPLLVTMPQPAQSNEAVEQGVRQEPSAQRDSESQAGQTREQATRQASVPPRDEAIRSARFYRLELPLTFGRYNYLNGGAPSTEIDSSAEIVAEVELTIPETEQNEDQEEGERVDLRHQRARSRRTAVSTASQRGNEGANYGESGNGCNNGDENENQANNDRGNVTVNNGDPSNRDNGNGNNLNDNAGGSHPNFSIQLRERRCTRRGRGSRRYT